MHRGGAREPGREGGEAERLPAVGRGGRGAGGRSRRRRGRGLRPVGGRAGAEGRAARAAAEDACALWLEKERRQRRPDILHPHAKVAANYTSAMYAKWQAKKRGYDEVLLVDEQGFLAEGPTTNFFLVDRDGALRTPPEQRRAARRHARARSSRSRRPRGGRCSRSRSARRRSSRAAEAFLTGTSAGVWPIASVDGRALGSACPGPVSEALGARFRARGRGRGSGLRRLAHLRGRGALDADPLRASSPRARRTSATTSVRSASTSSSRRAGRASTSSPTTTR